MASPEFEQLQNLKQRLAYMFKTPAPVMASGFLSRMAC